MSNQAKVARLRGPGQRFPKGVSGNPGGRPKTLNHAAICADCGGPTYRSIRQSRCHPCAAKKRETAAYAAVRRVGRENYLMRTYGLTPAAWDAMWRAQGQRCAVCGATSPEGRGWHLDHDHRLPANDPRSHRGILCRGCNSAAGQLRDSTRRAEALARYLRKWAQLQLVPGVNRAKSASVQSRPGAPT